MTDVHTTALKASESSHHENLGEDFVTMTVCGQLFGVPVLQVQDILGPQRITRVPLAPPEIVGALNLRGRIVTAMDIRIRLGLEPRPAATKNMNVIVQHAAELYSLIVDQVGEVINLPRAVYEKNPATLSAAWKDVSQGVYRRKDELLIALDVTRLLRMGG